MKNFYLLLIIYVIVLISLNYYLHLFLKKIKFAKYVKNFFVYFFSSIIFILFLDFYVLKLFGHGYPASVIQEKYQRAPSPYDTFSGAPYYKDHNSLGFRGNEFKNNNENIIQIAFFGGSTGYNGNPPIIKIIEKLISEKDIAVETFNFSSVSSNHNQHIHRLIKHSNLKFDIIIFYGGFNETLQTYFYDPRPTYPFNFWVRNELDNLKYLLLKYSSILSEYEFSTDDFSSLKKIKKDVNFKSDEWLDNLIENYYLTLKKAKKISENAIESNACGKTKFFAFYQPFSIKRADGFTKKIMNETKSFFNNKEILIDFSELVSENDFTDLSHVNQAAKNVISSEIFKVIFPHIAQECKLN